MLFAQKLQAQCLGSYQCHLSNFNLRLCKKINKKINVSDSRLSRGGICFCKLTVLILKKPPASFLRVVLLLSPLAVSVTKLLQHQWVYVGVCMLCMHPSGFVGAITCTFVHGFQNNLAQLFSSRSRSAI